MSLDKKKNKKKEVTKSTQIPKTAQQSLPYQECYDNGVILTNEGTFSKCYAFNDITFKTLADERQEELFQAYQQFLNGLNAQESLSFNFLNIPENSKERLEKIAPKSRNDALDEFRTEISEILEDKIRNARSSITTKKYMTYTTKSDTVAGAMKRFLDVDEELNKGMHRITKEHIRALDIAERLEVLHKLINSDRECLFFEHDEQGKTYIDWKKVRKQGLTTKDIIGAPLKFNVSNFMIGDRFGQSLFLDNIANWMNTDFIAELSECSFESSIALHIRPIETREASRLVHARSVGITGEVVQKQKEALKSGYSPEFIPTDLKNAKEWIDEMEQDMKTRDQKLFHFSLIMTHFADSPEELKRQYNMIKEVASKHYCTMTALTFQQERGFQSTLPLGISRTFTDNKLTTEQLAVFFPFNEVSCFEDGGFYYGINSVNKTVICKNRLSGQNYNGLILGSSGSGKSFAAKLEMIFSLLSTNDQVYIVDPDGEYGPIAEAFGGVVVKIAPGNHIYLNPMDLDVDNSFDTDLDPIAMKTDFVGGLLETMLGHNVHLNPVQKSIVNRCIIRVYGDYLAHLESLPPDANGKKRTIDRDACPTLQNLFNMLLNQPQPEAKNLALVMETYTTGSFDTFAHRTNVDVNNRLIVYDIKDIGSNLRDLGLKVCLNEIWTKMVENRAKGIWTRAYIDEFHLLLGSPSSADFLKSIWKRARKFWGVPTGITQNMEDLLLSPAARAIINNSSFVMILNQSAIDRANLADILNLSASDLEFITNADPGCGLIYTGKQTIPFRNDFPRTGRLYQVMSTKAGEK